MTKGIEFLSWNCFREGNAVSSEMSGGSHRDLSSHSTSEEDEDSKSEKVRTSFELLIKLIVNS